MIFEDCKVDMRVKGVGGTVLGKIGSIVDIDTRGRVIDIRWDGDHPDEPPRRYNTSIRYMEPINASPATMRSPERKTKSPDDIDRERQYAFFATCTLPGHCPKCTAPLPCKYH